MKLTALSRAASVIACGLLLAGCGDGGGNDGSRLVVGQSSQVNGQTISTAAIVDANNQVVETSVTVPMTLIDNMPMNMGTGPAGAHAVLNFPAEVQSTTVLNHAQVHFNPNGHDPAGTYNVAHIDLHAYFTTPAQVAAVTTPDTVAPQANRVPTGYTAPPIFAAVPQMGLHASPNIDFGPGARPFTSTMVLGYTGGQLTFVEPMITVTKLQQRQSFTEVIPVPQVVDKPGRYPTRMIATYNQATDSYTFRFLEFVQPTNAT
jgi:hypothetical protein